MRRGNRQDLLHRLIDQVERDSRSVRRRMRRQLRRVHRATSELSRREFESWRLALRAREHGLPSTAVARAKGRAEAFSEALKLIDRELERLVERRQRRA